MELTYTIMIGFECSFIQALQKTHKNYLIFNQTITRAFT